MRVGLFSACIAFGGALLANGATAMPVFHTAAYVPVPEDMPVTVIGPDHTADDIALAERIRGLLRDRHFAVLEEEAENGLVLTFATECTVPPVSRPRVGVDVGIEATEHGISTDLDVDARIVAPLQGDAASPPTMPSLRISMRLTGTGPRPRLYWTGDAHEVLGRKCSVELSPELAARLLDDLAARRAGSGTPSN